MAYPKIRRVTKIESCENRRMLELKLVVLNFYGAEGTEKLLINFVDRNAAKVIFIFNSNSNFEIMSHFE